MSRFSAIKRKSVLLLCVLFAASVAAAERELDLEQQREVLKMNSPYVAQFELPIYMQGEGIPWDHEINVVLPPSYHLQPDKKFPVLWVTDGALYLHRLPELLHSNGPQLIIVTVGHRGSETTAEFARKRTQDLFTKDTLLAREGDVDDPASIYFKKQGYDLKELFKEAHAEKFLDFLVDEVRPALAKRYRMADDHGLFGHSAGGFFTSWSLFARPGTFKRYVISSGVAQNTLMMERDYAKTHDDLDATVFVGAGDMEANSLFGASQRFVSNSVRLAENLHLREYPSLTLEVRVYRGKNHSTVVPMTLNEGVRFAYQDLMPSE